MDGFDYTELDPEERTNKFLALFSVALGLISLCAGLLPICGGVTSMLAIGFGLFGLRSGRRTMAYVGIAIAILGLLISVTYGLMAVLQ